MDLCQFGPINVPHLGFHIYVLAHIYMESKEKKKKGHEEPSGKTGIKTQTY